MIDYDFIEIGTCDFDNLIESANDSEIGLSIEPVKIYFDNLPIKKNIKKINCAISNTNTELDCHWVHPNDIEKYNLPIWIRGCGTINHKHPLVIRELESRNLMHLYNTNKCEVIDWQTLIIRENINSVKFLKIDAEGSDYAILESILDSKIPVYPDKIQFENKDFIDGGRLDKLLQQYLLKNYQISNLDLYNIILKKNGTRGT